MKTIGLILGTVLGTAVVVFLSSIWSGYVLTKLWGWFVSSTFNLPFFANCTSNWYYVNY